MTECSRLADQIRRAFDGEAWHGDALVEVLKNVSAAQAAARPIKNAHTIWEIVLHIAAWDRAVLRRIGGAVVNLSDSENFPSILDTGESAWKTAVEQTRRVHSDLVKAVAAFHKLASARTGARQGEAAILRLLLYVRGDCTARDVSHWPDRVVEEDVAAIEGWIAIGCLRPQHGSSSMTRFHTKKLHPPMA